MSDITDLMDRAKTAYKATSDNQLATKLKVSRQAVSAWRKGNATPDAITCAKLAEITGVPLAKVLGVVGEARAISQAEKAVWRQLASAALLVISTLPLWAHAAPYGGHESQPVIYIMRN